MSFSKDVKEELSKIISESRHCRLAELAALFEFCGQISRENESMVLEIMTENELVARKCFTLLEKTFNIDTDLLFVRNLVYGVRIRQEELIIQLLQAVKAYPLFLEVSKIESIRPKKLVTQQNCCKRAFLRGVFLAIGSISDPQKAYHFELVTQELWQAEQVQQLIYDFGIDAKIVFRKKNYVVYIKEGSQIVDLLNIMEAHIALMELENIRILKEVRNSINRQVNCEAANLNKTVVAASKQISDIRYIQDHYGFSELTEGLEAVAKLRLEFPEASLTELGEMVIPPLGRSGVNHRLKKLSQIADDLKSKRRIRDGREKSCF